MNIEYRTQKDLPCNELYQLFLAVGWATEETTNPEQRICSNPSFSVMEK